MTKNHEGKKKHKRMPKKAIKSHKHSIEASDSLESHESNASTRSQSSGNGRRKHGSHRKHKSKHSKGKKKSVEHLGHHDTLSEKKHADAAATRAAIVAQQRESAEFHAVPVLLLSARAINRRRFAKNTGMEKRKPSPGPRPTDIPPRLKPGLRYTEGGLPDVYSGILRKDLSMVSAYLEEAGRSDQNTRGANQQLGTYPNGTLLHLAAQHSSVDILNLLLKHGADIHSVDELGNTPLHRAVKSGNINMVKALLKHKPTEVENLLTARNIDEMTAVQMSIQFGFEKIRSTFINHLKLSGKIKFSDDDRASAGMMAQHKVEMRKIRKKEEELLRLMREAEENKAALEKAVLNEAKLNGMREKIQVK